MNDFADPTSSPLQFITFRNSYASCLTIKQLVISSKTNSKHRDGRSRGDAADAGTGKVWRTVLDRFPLMHRPHEDNGGQAGFTIPVSQVRSPSHMQ